MLRTYRAKGPVAACVIGLALLVAGCAGPRMNSPSTATYTMQDFARVPKFDAHIHANTRDTALIDQARVDGFELLSINVDYPDFPAVEEQASVARTLAAAAPNFHHAATFTLDGWGTPAFAPNANAAIRAAVQNGAVAVKVWKNVGMSLRDKSGRLVMVDDARFKPIWEQVRALGIPLIGHQGEPYNCWLPLEKMTTENDRAYFAAHPQYHMYLHPEMPSYEAQMAARDRMLRANPRLRFVGAHAGSLEWSVDRLAAFLDANPRAEVDLAARMAQVQYQSVRNHDKVRDFFIRYQDRLLYGSDLTHNPGADPTQMRQSAHEVWLADWRYLATGESQHVANIKADVRGLGLPRAVIDKIYNANARRVFNRARQRG